MRMSQATPIIRFYDEGLTKEFYIDFLGFQLEWEHRYEADMPLYMQIIYGECVLHLSQHFGDGIPGSVLRIGVEDLAAYAKQLREKRYSFARPGEPLYEEDLTLTDPAGNRIRFYEIKPAE